MAAFFQHLNKPEGEEQIARVTPAHAQIIQKNAFRCANCYTATINSAIVIALSHNARHNSYLQMNIYKEMGENGI